MHIFTIQNNKKNDYDYKESGGYTRRANEHLAKITRCQAADWKGCKECNESSFQKELC
jgi:hypothetical protein